jgi:hypothetical protein
MKLPYLSGTRQLEGWLPFRRILGDTKRERNIFFVCDARFPAAIAQNGTE